MRRPWLRLVACITAAAVLVTNTPGMLAALRFHATAAQLCHGCRHQADCPCCSGHEQQTSATPDRRCHRSVNEGACQPNKEQQPSCPLCPACPGGCPWCTVSHALGIGALPASSSHLAKADPGQRAKG